MSLRFSAIFLSLALLLGACSGQEDKAVSPEIPDTQTTEAVSPETSGTQTTSAVSPEVPDTQTAVENKSDASKVLSDMFSGEIILSSDGVPTGVELDRTYSRPRYVSVIESGEYTLELRDVSGEILRSIQFEVKIPVTDAVSESEESEALPITQKVRFHFVVSNPPEYINFSITWRGTQIASYTRSENSPSVAIAGPSDGQIFTSGDTIDLSWIGSDSDEDELTYRLYFSANGGESYRLESIETTDTAWSIWSRAFSGSYMARFGISVSDGTRSSFSETSVFYVLRSGDEKSDVTPDTQSTPVSPSVDSMSEIFSKIDPLINEAIKICSDGESQIFGTNCAPSVRKICNSGKHFLETDEVQRGDRDTVKFICDLAAFTEVRELALVLAVRYGDRFRDESYRYEDSCPRRISDILKPNSFKQWTINPPDAVDFIIFRAVRDYWGFRLSYLFFFFDPETGSHADPLIPCLVHKRNYNTYKYDGISDIVLNKLESLHSVARNRHLANKITIELTLSQRDSTSPSLSELESLWLQLPYVCAFAEIAPENSNDDACRRAAIAICQHHSIPSPKPWEPQLWYEQRHENPVVDFACGLGVIALLES